MAQVSVENVSKSFGSLTVVHDINVMVPDGKFIVLVGPSGCGKSTLLRMIAGLEEISSGVVKIGARVVNDLPASKRDIAMVFQNYALYPHKNVAENMGFSLKMAHLPLTEINARVENAAQILGLEPYLKRYPRELSGGQRQRVAMGRSIVRKPQVFLFDEPLSNLDAKLRVQMRSEIRELHQTLGTTTIYVTHDQIEAMTMADQIVVMREGRIAQTGTPLDLYDNPASVFVAEFIGSPSMNMVSAIVKGGAKPSVVLNEETLLLPPDLSVKDGQEITLGIRPENLILSQKGKKNILTAKVIVIEPTGSETHVVMRFGKQDIVAVFRERHPLEIGQIIHLTYEPEKVHFFDTKTGLNLGS
ncbi:MAG: sugar ABC transporter ATP-binding protein [Rhodobacter sp. BACL10 MAG-120910-bin24]|jgi:multiple sugar transport system ATP-binding protein|nr:MAG: sugar ABC transporter ATP-binding protein [Rhodobacter sp. BACL10 MAG-120910-bin24]KRP25256.1 MAG: sugar ABC transporter ATP-binding protein [Rhodobacter sp. BACL10 MAG-120419-bin15]|tara:strand:+ start:13635 stop:14711 length:1077 start_codon:yes stop_codon:yes gene_type:complete